MAPRSKPAKHVRRPELPELPLWAANDRAPEIFTGTSIVDRRSVFQVRKR